MDDRGNTWYTCIMQYDSAITKNEILLFATTWMDLEGIALSEISQAEKDTYHVISPVCGIQNPKPNKHKLLRDRGQTDGCQTGRGLG